MSCEVSFSIFREKEACVHFNLKSKFSMKSSFTFFMGGGGGGGGDQLYFVLSPGIIQSFGKKFHLLVHMLCITDTHVETITVKSSKEHVQI